MPPEAPTPVIRAVTVDDHSAVRDVVARAFDSAAHADLVDAVRASAAHMPDLELVADAGGEIVGHVMISGTVLRNEAGDRQVAMLSPLSVHPRHQRRGIGGRLVRAVTARADAAGEPLVILEGNPNYYGRFGFEPSLVHGIAIHLPDWAPPEAAQVLPLSSYDATDQSLRGTVVHPTAFDGFD